MLNGSESDDLTRPSADTPTLLLRDDALQTSLDDFMVVYQQHTERMRHRKANYASHVSFWSILLLLPVGHESLGPLGSHSRWKTSFFSLFDEPRRKR